MSASEGRGAAARFQRSSLPTFLTTTGTLLRLQLRLYPCQITDVQSTDSVATGVAAYQYKPLQNRRVARLLTLQPAPQSVPIVVSLTEACIGDDLDYEVISYTWGTEDEDDKRSSLILCNGGYIRVTVNCEVALLTRC